jgi:hypothetical protein
MEYQRKLFSPVFEMNLAWRRKLTNLRTRLDLPTADSPIRGVWCGIFSAIYRRLTTRETKGEMRYVPSRTSLNEFALDMVARLLCVVDEWSGG